MWRDLPGPALFLQGVVQDLRQGRNVVVAMPETAPPGMREALASRVAANDYVTWRTLFVTEDNRDSLEPADLIGRRFASFEAGSQAWTPTRLATAGALAGHIVWVEGIPAREWPTWRRFLSDFEHERRNASPDSLLLCVALVGVAEKDLLQPGPALGIRVWKGVVEPLDVWLHVSKRLHTAGRGRLHARTRASVCASLAGADLNLAVHLASLPLRELVSPAPALTAWAQALGWNDETIRSSQWHLGVQDEVEGRPFIHSAALALSGEYEEVDRRVWRGQVGVLFPFLEEWRNHLTVALRHLLTLPFYTPFGVIIDPRDLEPGHLLWMARRKGAEEMTLRHLERLARMRHALAHMEPVEPDDLLEVDDLPL